MWEILWKYERNICCREGRANIFGICAGCCTNGNPLELNGEIMELQESKQRMMDRGGNCCQPIFGNLSKT